MNYVCDLRGNMRNLGKSIRYFREIFVTSEEIFVTSGKIFVNSADTFATYGNICYLSRNSRYLRKYLLPQR